MAIADHIFRASFLLFIFIFCRFKGAPEADRASKHTCCEPVPKRSISRGRAAILHRRVCAILHLPPVDLITLPKCMPAVNFKWDSHGVLSHILSNWYSQRWRETSEEKRSIEKTEQAIINEVRQAAEVHRQVRMHASALQQPCITVSGFLVLKEGPLSAPCMHKWCCCLVCASSLFAAHSPKGLSMRSAVHVY